MEHLSYTDRLFLVKLANKSRIVSAGAKKLMGLRTSQRTARRALSGLPKSAPPKITPPKAARPVIRKPSTPSTAPAAAGMPAAGVEPTSSAQRLLAGMRTFRESNPRAYYGTGAGLAVAGVGLPAYGIGNIRGQGQGVDRSIDYFNQMPLHKRLGAAFRGIPQRQDL